MSRHLPAHGRAHQVRARFSDWTRMADVFISYASENRDRALAAGDDYANVIERELL